MATQRETKEKTYVVVDFLTLDKEKISFGLPKKNKHGGLTIPLKYEGKNLYVRYPRRVVPFGVGKNTEKPKNKSDPEKLTGHTLALSCNKSYESDALYQKADELDQFFIESCISNSFAWGLGGSKTKPIARESVEGYDDKGHKGMWKRLLKWSSKTDPTTQEKTYLDYPPRVELAVSANIKGDAGEETATFTVPFFDHNGDKVKGTVDDSNVDDVLPKFSEVSAVANWGNLTQGTYGCTLKPRAEQLRVYPRDELPSDECLIDDDDNGGERLGDDEGLGAPAASKSRNVSTVPAPPTKVPKPSTAADSDDDGGEVNVDYADGSDGEAPVPAPSLVAAKPVPTRRVATRVASKPVN